MLWKPREGKNINRPLIGGGEGKARPLKKRPLGHIGLGVGALVVGPLGK